MHDKLHLQGRWPIGAEVLECTAVQGELERHGKKLAHTFDLKPPLRMHGRCTRLGKRRSNLCVARVIKEGEVSLTEMQLINDR